MGPGSSSGDLAVSNPSSDVAGLLRARVWARVLSLTPTWVMLGVLWAAGARGAARLPAVRQGREYGRRACPVQFWKVWLLRTAKVGGVHVSHFWPEDSSSYSSSSALAPDERKKDDLQRQGQAEHYISSSTV